MTDRPRPPTCFCQGPIPSIASRASLGLPARSLFAVSRFSELVRPRAPVWSERLPSEGASRRQLSAWAKSIISKVSVRTPEFVRKVRFWLGETVKGRHRRVHFYVQSGRGL